MQEQTERAERSILEQAQQQLVKAEADIKESRAAAFSGDKAAVQRYQDAILERGRLNQVIAQAKEHLDS